MCWALFAWVLYISLPFQLSNRSKSCQTLKFNLIYDSRTNKTKLFGSKYFARYKIIFCESLILWILLEYFWFSAKTKSRKGHALQNRSENLLESCIKGRRKTYLIFAYQRTKRHKNMSPFFGVFSRIFRCSIDQKMFP